MASADQQNSTPQVKFENSPAESFVSVPGGEMYPSLFCTPIPTTMNPMESVMSPQSLVGDAASSIAQSVSVSSTPAPESEKKPVKKRKSWGQVLPEPKTNLPPRKRAKTEDEKEQRRVERVLRNRRAAQSSRERKRQEVEALEKRNQELEQLLLQQQKQNVMLMNELSRFRREAGVVTRGSSPLDSFQPSPLTLSQPLFGSQANSEAKSGMMDDFILMPSATDDTVNPARLSPELSPVADTEAPVSSTPVAPANTSTTTTSSNDVTQHPAAVLCDLQCPSAEASAWSMVSRPRQQPALGLYLHLQLLWTISSVMLSACQRPLTLIAGALKHNLALHPTPSILSTIIWMVTLPSEFRTSTFHSSSATMSAAQLRARPQQASLSPKNSSPHSASLTLRIKSLQKLLTSSPILARPLMDATMELLRLVSEGCDDRVKGLTSGSPGIKGDQSRLLQTWPDGARLPSREVLLTLLWAIKVEERKMIMRETTIGSLSASTRPGSSVLRDKKTNQTYVLSAKRKREMDVDSRKRARRSC